MQTTKALSLPMKLTRRKYGLLAILKIRDLRYSSTADAASKLGGIANIRDAFVGFQKHLYKGDGV